MRELKGIRAERVAKEFNKFIEVYEVPDEKEFAVKNLILLQDQFSYENEYNIKTKIYLLQMIQQLEKSLNLRRLDLLEKTELHNYMLDGTGDSKKKINNFLYYIRHKEVRKSDVKSVFHMYGLLDYNFEIPGTSVKVKDLLDPLRHIWDEIPDEDKKDVAALFVGKFHLAKFILLMNYVSE